MPMLRGSTPALATADRYTAICAFIDGVVIVSVRPS
jgi:hypothetical protein